MNSPFITAIFPGELCERPGSKDQRVISAMIGGDHQATVKHQICIVYS